MKTFNGFPVRSRSEAVFGEYCPVCDENDDDTFVGVSVNFDEGDVVTCKKGHNLVCCPTDSDFVDVRLKVARKNAPRNVRSA